MPSVNPQLVSTVAATAGEFANAAAVNHQNRRSEVWSQMMYDRQYKDNIAFWNMQNEYNSPQAQMQRLQQAGLNPALMYGQSNPGGTASPINTPDVQSVQRRSPEWGNAINSGATAYLNALYDFDIKQAQVDNLKADNTVKLSQAALLAAQTSRSEFDLGFESELRQISSEARRESLRKLRAETDMSLDENERRALTTGQSVQESIERVINMRIARSKDESTIELLKQQRDSVSKDVQLKQLDIELKRAGINPNDPMYARILTRVLTQMFEKSDETPASVLDKVRGFELPDLVFPKDGLPYFRKPSSFRPHNVRP